MKAHPGTFLGRLPILATLLLLAGCSTSPLSPVQTSGQSQAFSADPTAASLSVLSGQADVLESVRGDAFTQARKSTADHSSPATSPYRIPVFKLNTIIGIR